MNCLKPNCPIQTGTVVLIKCSVGLSLLLMGLSKNVIGSAPPFVFPNFTAIADLFRKKNEAKFCQPLLQKLSQNMCLKCNMQNS